MDFGTRRIDMVAPTGDSSLGCPCSYDENINQRIHTAKVGINYRFGNYEGATSVPVAPVPSAALHEVERPSSAEQK